MNICELNRLRGLLPETNNLSRWDIVYCKLCKKTLSQCTVLKIYAQPWQKVLRMTQIIIVTKSAASSLCQILLWYTEV